MKLTKSLIIFGFLLAFVIQVSAQDKTPKIVWKNLQEKYERFEDIKPIIVNNSNERIYMFADVNLGIVHDYLKLYRFSETNKNWQWFYRHGHPINKEYQLKVMSNFSIEPLKEREIMIDDEGWFFLTETDGLEPYVFRDNPIYKGKGKYKFTVQFYFGDKKSKKFFNSESPAFEITKDQKKYFDK